MAHLTGLGFSAYVSLKAVNSPPGRADRGRYVVITPGTGVRNPLLGGAGVGSCARWLHPATHPYPSQEGISAASPLKTQIW